MEFKSKLLDITPEAVADIRKMYNLDNDDRRNEAIDKLQDWVNKQEHFTRKDFNRQYLETALISNKGSIERAKQKLEKLCTFRTMLPAFFKDVNPKDLTGLEKVICGYLPKYDKGYHRVYVYKNLGSDHTPDIFTNYFREKVMVAEYLRHHDYCNGFVLIFDITQENIMDLIAGFNLIETKNLLTLLMEGYGLRLKAMHIIMPNSASSLVYELLLKVCKAVLNQWMDEIGSKEHMQLMKEANQFKVDPAKKKDIKYYEDFHGQQLQEIRSRLILLSLDK